jgi:murein DD-endopeptidase MepM/ murein hydrolase activator NlpD
MIQLRVNIDALNVRDKPGIVGTRVIRVLRNRMVVTANGEEITIDGSRWFRIIHPADGWVVARYVDSVGSISFRFEAWPAESRTITQKYGANPDYYMKFGLPGHEGVDIRAVRNSKIFAVAQGTVRLVLTDPRNRDDGGHNYGIQVRITHAEGYETIYAHLSAFNVLPGDSVRAGQQIGLADNTGNSFGDHLHLTLKRHGVIIDPTPFLAQVL